MYWVHSQTRFIHTLARSFIYFSLIHDKLWPQQNARSGSASFARLASLPGGRESRQLDRQTNSWMKLEFVNEMPHEPSQGGCCWRLRTKGERNWDSKLREPSDSNRERGQRGERLIVHLWVGLFLLLNASMPQSLSRRSVGRSFLKAYCSEAAKVERKENWSAWLSGS